MNYRIRIAKRDDLKSIFSVFRSSILEIIAIYYSKTQKEAWITKGFDNLQRWKDRIKNDYFIVAEYQNQIVGFSSLRMDGLANLLFVHPDYQRLGIASTMYQKLEIMAIDRNIKALTTDASEVSKSFFERKGFKLVKENRVIIEGVDMRNYSMIKKLTILNKSL